jgi:hypothetical protein
VKRWPAIYSVNDKLPRFGQSCASRGDSVLSIVAGSLTPAANGTSSDGSVIQNVQSCIL